MGLRSVLEVVRGDWVLCVIPGDPNADARHLEQAIQLALKCLSFDFVGTSLDESTEDPGNIQVCPSLQ